MAGLLQATSLPFLVAATAIGRELGLIGAGEGAALVGAGLLSVLLFPAAGLALLRRSQPTNEGIHHADRVLRRTPTRPMLASPSTG